MSEQPTLPTLNGLAPQFEAQTTHGPKSLKDYAGRWLVLFSHPADFTPVCTTEFVGFAKAFPDFQAVNCDLLGLSIDSVYSHIAWVRDIESKFGVKIEFPVIADLSMDVAHKYGMIHKGAASTATVRCVFVIDPVQRVRAMIYYPLSNGRSIAEILRLVRGLQASDEHSIATPEGWQIGDAVIVPPPTTQAAAQERMEAGLETTEWYLSKKPLA